MASRKRVKTNLSLSDVMTSEKHFTKKEMALRASTCPRSVCPPVPVKLRKSNGKKLFNFHDYAVPIYFQKEIPLSKLYNRDLKISYMDQLFVEQIKIGEGSFGHVYRVRSKEDDLLYAVKVAKNSHTNYHEKFGEVLRLEKVAEHNRCVKYYLAWEEEGQLHIQLELCMTSLDKFAHQNHFIPEQQMWDILVDMLEALKHLHDRNLIHLDIKPENILITKEGTYKLGDFGLLLDLNELNDKKKQQKHVNVSEGDSKYLAAEVLEGKYTKASDIFSLGISMLELATDLMLPANGTLWHQLRKGIYPEIFEENVSLKLRSIIEKMMDSKYMERPSVNQLLEMAVIKRILKDRQKGLRVNFMMNWMDSNENCISEDIENENIPVVYLPSPYDIKVPASDPQLRSPLRERYLQNDSTVGTSMDNSWLSPSDINCSLQSSTPVRAQTPVSGFSRVKLYSV